MVDRRLVCCYVIKTKSVPVGTLFLFYTIIEE